MQCCSIRSSRPKSTKKREETRRMSRLTVPLKHTSIIAGHLSRNPVLIAPIPRARRLVQSERETGVALAANSCMSHTEHLFTNRLIAQSHIFIGFPLSSLDMRTLHRHGKIWSKHVHRSYPSGPASLCACPSSNPSSVSQVCCSRS